MMRNFGIEKTRRLVGKKCYTTGTFNTNSLLDGYELPFDPYHHQPADTKRISRWIMGPDGHIYKLEKALFMI